MHAPIKWNAHSDRKTTIIRSSHITVVAFAHFLATRVLISDARLPAQNPGPKPEARGLVDPDINVVDKVESAENQSQISSHLTYHPALHEDQIACAQLHSFPL